ncbi:MAG: flagellin [Alphaproteobacteria bacterium]|nr:flagellin [Alphaproteobacteria bacterium]
MSVLISTLGIQLTNTDILTTSQSKLLKLNEQLASEKRSNDLTDYTPSEALNLLNLNSTIKKREGFLGSINAIDTRLKVYDQSLTGLEEIAAEASSLTTTAPTYNSESNGSTAQQIQGFMKQVSFYLNQQVGDRYIFSGTRYETVPVKDITELPLMLTTTPTTTVVDPVLPDYDAEAPYLPPPPATEPDPVPTNSDADAYVQDNVSIDTTQKLQYGITSTQEPFQQLIMGLRFAYSATQDQTNYSELMTIARDLINQGLSGIRGVHSDLASSQTILDKVKTRHTQSISDVNSEITSIQSVDVNEVAVKINAVKTQLEASYSATAKMQSLSILNYL